MARGKEGILEIRNRTENWKTARYLSPFFGTKAIRLANKLEKGMAGKPKSICQDQVHLELYWKGMRDFIKKSGKDSTAKKPTVECLAKLYREFFSCLSQKIVQFNSFKNLNPCNYNVDKKEYEKKLYDNLRNTEIDIVLETPEYLFIGEAKDESGFGADGNLILVHQLIRQYVMAKILANGCLKRNITVVPFIVGEDIEDLKRTAQVQFMKKHYNLKHKNILSWNFINDLEVENLN